MRFDINGHSNPVEAAKLSMQAMGFEIDEASFDILADQCSVGETVGEAAPGADDAAAVRSSEEIISEIVRHHNGRLVRFAGGPFDGKTMVWTGGDIIQVDEAPPPVKITDKQPDQPPPFTAHVAGHIYRQSADHDVFVYEGPRT